MTRAMRLKHVNVKHLAKYLAAPMKSTFEIAESLYLGKRWINGVGAVTPAGELVLAEYRELGEAAQLPRSHREALRMFAYRHPRMQDVPRAVVKKLRSHELLHVDALTDKGRRLLVLFGEDGERE